MPPMVRTQDAEVRPGGRLQHVLARTVVAMSTRAAVADCAFLAAMTVLSLVLYVGGLGFYYDDYQLLERMGESGHRSVLGLYDAVSPGTGQRPLQALTYAVLYRLFGAHPLGYHVFNAAIFVVAIVLIYLVLRELRLPRFVSVAVPLVYAMLPHYSTDRFWAAAFQANTSTAFYALGTYAALRALRSSRRAFPVWLLVAVLSVAGSLFAYEVAAPLFLLSAGLVWLAGRASGRRRVVVAVLGGALLAAVIAKSTLVVTGGQNGYRVGFQGGVLHHLVYLVSGAIKLNVGTYLVALPYVLWWIVVHHFAVSTLVVAVASGALAFAYLANARDRGDAEAVPWSWIVAAGFAVFVLGYAVFLTNDQILFRSAGIDNRVNAASALGIALMVVGAIGWVARLAQAGRQSLVRAAAVACVVAVGVFIVDSLASFWADAYKRQHAIVAGLTQQLGRSPRAGVVVLDAACPELGPAVVFADQYDLGGALWLHYRDSRLTADVATPDLRTTPRGLRIGIEFLGEASSRTYPYGAQLRVYDARRRRLYAMVDSRAAQRYLTHSRPLFACPPQRSFAWGFRISRRWPFV
jgi:hypothetical protein